MGDYLPTRPDLSVDVETAHGLETIVADVGWAAEGCHGAKEAR